MKAWAAAGSWRPICAWTLFWKAPSWLKADVELPRSNDAVAAFNEAISGRLLLRVMSVASTRATVCSTASPGLITQNCTVLEQDAPDGSVAMKVTVWQPRSKQFLTTGPKAKATPFVDHEYCRDCPSGSVADP